MLVLLNFYRLLEKAFHLKFIPVLEIKKYGQNYKSYSFVLYCHDCYLQINMIENVIRHWEKHPWENSFRNPTGIQAGIL
jgi:hypothetical protein